MRLCKELREEENGEEEKGPQSVAYIYILDGKKYSREERVSPDAPSGMLKK